MADGKLAVLTAQMYVHDSPSTGAGLPEFLGLFQGPDGIDDDDSSLGRAAGDAPYRIDDPASPLKCGTEPMSLKLAPVKIAASASQHKAGSTDVLGGNLPYKIPGERGLT